MFIRWYVKEYYGVDTATTEEIKIIDEAFDKVALLYPKNLQSYSDSIPIKLEFEFLGKRIVYNIYDLPEHKSKKYTPDSLRLIRFFEITHAFFDRIYIGWV